MKKLLLIVICICLIGGCSRTDGQDVKQDIQPEIEKNIEQEVEEDIQPGATPDITEENTLVNKLEGLSFVPVSDYYIRNVKQDDMDITEMFVTGENSFVRIAISDDEEEVFSYNYITDEFCYLYYFSDEQIAKVVYNIGKDKVIEDKYSFIDSVKTDATALKKYFNSLIESAGINIEELL